SPTPDRARLVDHRPVRRQATHDPSTPRPLDPSTPRPLDHQPVRRQRTLDHRPEPSTGRRRPAAPPRPHAVALGHDRVMSTPVTFEIRTELAAPAVDVWAHATSMAGVNEELGPWVRMTHPADLSDLSTAPPDLMGSVAFRSW